MRVLLIAVLAANVALCLRTGLEMRLMPIGGKGEAVSIPFFVTKKNGDPVVGIAPSDIKILDDGRPPDSAVSITAAKDRPLRLALVIDDSGSENFNQNYLPTVNAAGAFIRNALTTGADRAMVVVFSDRSKSTEFMDKNQIGHFSVSLARRGGTALYDAIEAVRDHMYYDLTENPRRVVVIVAQGDDNSSRTRLQEAINGLEQLHAVIFFVDTANTLPRIPLEAFQRKRLDDAVENAGGFVYEKLKPSDLGNTFAGIRALVDAELIATYRPVQGQNTPEWHSIRFRPAKSGLGWHIHVSKQYDDN